MKMDEPPRLRFTVLRGGVGGGGVGEGEELDLFRFLASVLRQDR